MPENDDNLATLTALNDAVDEAKTKLAWYVAAAFGAGRTPSADDLEHIRSKVDTLNAAHDSALDYCRNHLAAETNA